MALTDQAELRQLDDSAVLAAAVSRRRAVVTYNRDDFLALSNEYLEREREHYGVVIINSRRFPQRQPATIGRIVSSLHTLARTDPGMSFLIWLQ